MKSQNIRQQNIPEGPKIISGLSVWSVQVVLVLVAVPSGHSGFHPKWLLHDNYTLLHTWTMDINSSIHSRSLNSTLRGNAYLVQCFLHRVSCLLSDCKLSIRPKLIQTCSWTWKLKQTSTFNWWFKIIFNSVSLSNSLLALS